MCFKEIKVEQYKGCKSAAKKHPCKRKHQIEESSVNLALHLLTNILGTQ